MLVRREQPEDVNPVRDVVKAAFRLPDGAADPVEATLLDRLRKHPSWIPRLSLVAETPTGDVVGHVVCTRGTVDDRPVLGLGPLAVHPDQQRRGVGSALMHAALGAAEAMDEPLVVLLGDPNYYRRFGFRQSAEYGIIPPNRNWGRYFQVRTLCDTRPQPGTFAYPEPFHEL